MPKKGYQQTEDHKQKIGESKLGKPHSEATKQKISESEKGCVAWNKGQTGLISKEGLQRIRATHLGKILSEETKQKISEARLNQMTNSLGPWRDTKPELSFERQLQEVSLEYTKQKRVGNMLVDFYLPQQNLVIEVDGCWWHGCPDCHPNGGATVDGFEARRQRLAALGYDAIRIWEHELIGDRDVIER